MTSNVTKIIVAALFSVAVVGSVAIFARSIINRNVKQHTISVKGMATRDFESDFVVWELELRRQAATPKEGTLAVLSDAEQVRNYLTKKEVTEDEVETLAVSYFENNRSFYDNASSSYVTIRDGYNVAQRIKVSSSDIDKIERVARGISDLLGAGVMIEENNIQYHYTQLANLKLEMLGEAAQDARNRAEKIASESNASVGGLKSATMGVFQILGRFSSNEEYSWGGTFNTSSREKTATITVSSVFTVK